MTPSSGRRRQDMNPMVVGGTSRRCRPETPPCDGRQATPTSRLRERYSMHAFELQIPWICEGSQF